MQHHEKKLQEEQGEDEMVLLVLPEVQENSLLPA